MKDFLKARTCRLPNPEKQEQVRCDLIQRRQLYMIYTNRISPLGLSAFSDPRTRKVKRL
jgi:hypothetical protein